MTLTAAQEMEKKAWTRIVEKTINEYKLLEVDWVISVKIEDACTFDWASSLLGIYSINEFTKVYQKSQSHIAVSCSIGDIRKKERKKKLEAA